MTDEMQMTVFYVDDDADDRDFFRMATADLVNTVAIFNLGDEMLKAMHNPPPMPSIIFLDLNMPIKSGFDILAEIRKMKIFEETPIIALSTASDPATVERCWNLGADIYLTKSSSIQTLKRCIGEIIALDWSKPRSREAFVFCGDEK